MCGLGELDLPDNSFKGSFTIGKNKAIAVEEIRGVRGVAHHILPQRDANSSHANCTTKLINTQVLGVSFMVSSYPG